MYWLKGALKQGLEWDSKCVHASLWQRKWLKRFTPSQNNGVQQNKHTHTRTHTCVLTSAHTHTHAHTDTHNNNNKTVLVQPVDLNTAFCAAGTLPPFWRHCGYANSKHWFTTSLKVPESGVRSVGAILAQLSAGVLVPDARLASGLKLRNPICGPRPWHGRNVIR